MRRTLATAIVALSFLAGCGSGQARESAVAAPTKPAVFQVTGKFALTLPDFTWNESPISCAGKGGYDDLRAGAQVVVTDPAGTTVGVGEVSESIPITEWDDEEDLYRAAACTLRFRVLDVPAGKGFYGVEVSHRGRVQYAEAAMKKELELTVG